MPDYTPADLARDRRAEWICYQLLHNGEGPRGKCVTVMGRWMTAEDAAAEAAEYFDAEEQRRERFEENDPFDGEEQVIEVCKDRSETKGYRVRVHCEVRRVYSIVIR